LLTSSTSIRNILTFIQSVCACEIFL